MEVQCWWYSASQANCAGSSNSSSSAPLVFNTGSGMCGNDHLSEASIPPSLLNLDLRGYLNTVRTMEAWW